MKNKHRNNNVSPVHRRTWDTCLEGLLLNPFGAIGGRWAMPGRGSVSKSRALCGNLGEFSGGASLCG